MDLQTATALRRHKVSMRDNFDPKELILMNYSRLGLGCIASALSFLVFDFSVYAENLTISAKGERGKVVQVQVQSEGKVVSLGSGVWISEDGYVATCFHVVNVPSSTKIQVLSAVDPLFDLANDEVVTGNWEIYDANIVTTDTTNDISILKVSKNPFKAPAHVFMKIGDNALQAHYEKAELEVKLPAPGEEILIGGYPLGLPYLVFQEGTVSSVAAFGPFANTIKILLSAVANHGNSGGPVFNDRGNVIGLLEGELPGQERERTGLEYVVPAFYIETLMKQLPTLH
jgi:S1-C subfamily serine protease